MEGPTHTPLPLFRLAPPAYPSVERRGEPAVYGKCNNPYGHGHDYVLEVTLAGSVDRIERTPGAV